MSRYDYEVAKALYRDDPPFYGLIMAAMLRADTDNARRLRSQFPETWNELQARYDAPGGILPSDPEQTPPDPAGSPQTGGNGPQEGD